MRQTITGLLEQITYRNEDNDYTVGRFSPDSGDIEGCTIVGHLSGVNEGEHLRLSGEWTRHPQYGLQFNVQAYEFIYPDTEAGIERYLGSGMIKGIGPKIAERIVAHFGTDTLEVIGNDPARLREVSGLGRKKIESIRQAWDQQRGIRRLMVFLQSYGIGGSLAVRIYKRYKERGVEAVSGNPYRLIEEVRGIGFATADKIARSIGFDPESPLRLESGLMHTAQVAADRGHTCVPREKYLEHAASLLEVPEEKLEGPLDKLTVLGKLVGEQDDESGESFIYGQDLYWAELTAAETLASIIRRGPVAERPEAGLEGMRDRAVELFERSSGISLSDDQKEAIHGVLSRGVAVVTGGPGTGKTTLISALVHILEREHLKPVLAAPTGRAAKRMSEATGSPASTIHRLLGWSFTEGAFLHNSGQPLKGDVFIIDEVSMVDIHLLASLLDALPEGAMLVLVGDRDQLPSIGPGKVLNDLIESGVVPVYRLEQIFRQAARSFIVKNAHRVLEGRMPVQAGGDDENLPGRDFFLVNQGDPEKAREMVVRMAAERLRERFGIDPLNDLQVITPMNKGSCGTRELNRALQYALNPAGRKIGFARGAFRVGDRVMQLRNDYEKDVFNGDVGIIATCDEQEKTVRVEYDGRLVEYDSLDLDELTLAYAVTVHKSQGSEYPAVMITLLGQHHVMLQRNLLYTAISRGKRLVVLAGDPKAVQRAVSNARIQFRYSRLASRLRKLLKRC